MNGISRRALIGSLGVSGVSVVLSPHTVIAARQSTVSSRFSITTTERMLASEALLDYFARVAPTLFRPAGGALRFPSLSPSQPGMQYSTQLWDWDTYWTAIGLYNIAHLRNDSQLHGQISVHLQGCLDNFFDHQSPEGRLPIMIATDQPDFFQSTATQNPNPHNQAKPVMAQMALLLARETNDNSWFKHNAARVMRFYESWMKDNHSRTGLMVWGNDVAIGTDNDPTTYGRPPFSSASLFLNCLFYMDLKAAEELAKSTDHAEIAVRAKELAHEIGLSIQRYCWDERDHFYYSVDILCEDQRPKWLPGLKPGMDMSWSCLPMRIQTFAGFLPLWCGLATTEQAADLVRLHYLSDDRFRARFGVRSLSRHESMYSLAAHSGNPSNWLGPVWIVANYLVGKGLARYGFAEEAAELRDKTLVLLSNDLKTSKTLNEYYHPDSGAPLSHPGFIDWNMLALSMA